MQPNDAFNIFLLEMTPHSFDQKLSNQKTDFIG